MRMMWRFGVLVALGLTAAVGAAPTDQTAADAFYAAIRANDLPKLRSLTEAGASDAAKTDRGITPLMHAAAIGSVNAMKVLIDAGADVNGANDMKSTALMWSATEIGKMRLLLERGANVNLQSAFGRSALLIAAMSDRSSEIVRRLIAKGADVHVVDNANTTLLHAALSGNDMDTIRLAVDAGLDVNAADVAGFTPLMYAAQTGNLTAVRLLLAKGARVDAVSVKSDIPMLRVKNGAIALGGFTPLLLAAASAPPDLVAALLGAGADVNATDIRGMTPLMLAIATDHANPETIRLLLARGADLQAKSLAGETALDWALKFGPTPIVAMLQRAGAPASPRRDAAAGSPAPVGARPAVERSLALLEKTSGQYFAKGGCVACHAQNITDMTTAAARANGLRIDADEAANRQKMTKGGFVRAAPMMLQRMDGPGAPDVPLYALIALANSGAAPDWTTDAIAVNIAAQQMSDGRWHIGGIVRPPIEDGDITRTALAIRALKTYGPPARADRAARIDKAITWLRSAAAVTAEDRNLQLLGLGWGAADRKLVQSLADAIVALQRADGGWAQRSELESDAYATGQTLFALSSAAGMKPSDAAYQRGVKYLLSTQRADGSWYVRSRAVKFQPYFDSGFPYVHDQWISSMATGWATAALTFAVLDRASSQ